MNLDHAGKLLTPQTPGYWQERYDLREDQWDKGEASPALVDFLAQLAPELRRGRVLQPGCGRGHDLAQFAQAGFQCVGLDIARTAVVDAGEIHRPLVSAGRMEFHEENFFETAATHWAGQFDWFFEHTFFCAIEPRLRDDYTRNLLSALKPGGCFLAVFYNIQPDDGPPFGTCREELEERFLPHFDRLLDIVPRSWPNRTGLELLWWLRRK
ncbi:methyltransferase domain-containing protein [Oscillatoria laete-virens NRMC-F 0139]|nr:methyltransferase domain-containing protein [Oscillatoria laete-virens]MDL5054763.1 methyltransferase domain-containing protein [Oscillatoria laete-virens NRMC-F 0139]